MSSSKRDKKKSFLPFKLDAFKEVMTALSSWFRNTSSQISASLSANGKYVICASEDSHVYVWRYDADSRPRGSKGVVTVTKSYETFHCEEVTAAVPWPVTSTGGILGTHGNRQNGNIDSSKNCSIFSTNSNYFGDRVSITWPEENLHTTSDKDGPQNNGDPCNGGMQVQSRSAWGMVIVTAGRSGKIRTLQNLGFPIQI